jgi:hypothetical protein
VSIVTTNTDGGFNYISSVKSQAESVGMKVTSAATYNINSHTSIKSAFETIQATGTTTVILEIFGDAGTVLSVADELGMLQGNYWFICTSGFTELQSFVNVTSSTTNAFRGVWQVQRPSPYDASSSLGEGAHAGSTQVAREFRSWYRDLFNLDAPVKKGTARGYNPAMSSLFPMDGSKRLPNGCKNGSVAQQIAQTMGDIEVKLVRIY